MGRPRTCWGRWGADPKKRLEFAIKQIQRVRSGVPNVNDANAETQYEPLKKYSIDLDREGASRASSIW